MSLDVSLTLPKDLRPVASLSRQAIFIRRNGENVEISRRECDDLHPNTEPATITKTDIGKDGCVFDGNITHNLAKMAEAAGIYGVVWQPEKNEIHIAAELIEPLKKGLAKLQSEPDRFKQLNPSNGWGSYEQLVSFLTAYLEACQLYPTAQVTADR